MLFDHPPSNRLSKREQPDHVDSKGPLERSGVDLEKRPGKANARDIHKNVRALGKSLDKGGNRSQIANIQSVIAQSELKIHALHGSAFGAKRVRDRLTYSLRCTGDQCMAA